MQICSHSTRDKNTRLLFCEWLRNGLGRGIHAFYKCLEQQRQSEQKEMTNRKLGELPFEPPRCILLSVPILLSSIAHLLWTRYRVVVASTDIKPHRKSGTEAGNMHCIHTKRHFVPVLRLMLLCMGETASSLDMMMAVGSAKNSALQAQGGDHGD